MAHKEQEDFVEQVKYHFPDYFGHEAKVLEVGSFNVNGSVRKFFDETCIYTGIDIGSGDGVDIVCPAQDYDTPDKSFHTIISCECLEHNPYWKETLQNIDRMLSDHGLFILTCATTGREEHGTVRSDATRKAEEEGWITMPNVSVDTWDNEYYMNLTEEDIRSALDMEHFIWYNFKINKEHGDLYFWGMK